MDDAIFDVDFESLEKGAEDKLIYYVGTHVEIEEGISRFLNNIEKHGHILIGKPEIYDYLYHGRDVLYVIYYKSLTKLEYLEYMYEKRVGKHGKASL